MMILFYFISIFTGLKICILVFSISLFITSVIFYISSFFSSQYLEEDERKLVHKKSCIASIIFIIFILIGCFIPTTKDMIIAMSVDKLINSEQFNQLNSISQKGLTLIEMKLDKYIKEDKK